MSQEVPATADEKRYFWRLMERRERCDCHKKEIVQHEICYERLLEQELFDEPDYQWCMKTALWERREGASMWFSSWGEGEPSNIVLLNALLAADALDYSALSPETCKALRGLGVEIPDV